MRRLPSAGAALASTIRKLVRYDSSPSELSFPNQRGSRRRVYCGLHYRVRVHAGAEEERHRIRETRSIAPNEISEIERSSSTDIWRPR